jgi:predicted molibdopterin-dependent oxidoreductase YjgC
MSALSQDKVGLDAQQIIAGCSAGSIKTLLIAGENPVVSYPAQAVIKKALDAVDFLVVADLFLTETAQLADVVLPVCSYAEKEGTFTATDRRVQKITAAIPAVGQSRSEFQVYGELITLLGGQPAATQADAFAQIAAYTGISYAELGEGGAFAAVKLQPVQVVPKATITNVDAGKFTLLTGAALYHCGTMSLYGEGTVSVCGEAYVEISRTDAVKMNIIEGAEVKLTSSTGTVAVKARISPRMSEGVLFAPYHFADASINTVWSGAAVTGVTISK